MNSWATSGLTLCCPHTKNLHDESPLLFEGQRDEGNKHWNYVWFLTALLCCAAAICSTYSHISVVWDTDRGKLESGSLIQTSTTPHFMAFPPEIPF